MQNSQSYGEFIKGAFRAVFDDCAIAFPCLAKEFSRDLNRVNSAIEQHGLAFVCDIMPAFSKHLDQCLDNARLTHARMIHFGSFKRGSPVPRLLRGLMLRVFDLDGKLRQDADPQAVRYLRQVLNLFKKLEIDCGKEKTAKTVRSFAQHDAQVRSPTLDWAEPGFGGTSLDHVSFTDMCKKEFQAPDLFPDDLRPIQVEPSLADTLQRTADLFTSVLGVFDPYLYKPRHGPGVVADLPKGVNKYDYLRWSDKLESVFPCADFAYSNFGAWVDSFRVAKKSGPSTGSEPYGRLLAVPKVFSKPRLIASEPVSHQWCQQILRDFFYTRCEQSVLSRFVDFRSQDRNGALARTASHDLRHCTIDLSNASDSVSCWAVERLFRRSASLLDALRATRTIWLRQDLCRYTPTFFKVRKYSTMGNATTFPVQSLLFASVAVAACFHARGLAPSFASLKLISQDLVHVFGDDIIIPAYALGKTMDLLQALGFQVNADKTFTGEAFRESCGVDAFRGHDVTPARVLCKPERSRPGSVISTVDVHNNLLMKGMIQTAQSVRTYCERSVSKIQTVKYGSGMFGWYDMTTGRECLQRRYNRTLHRVEVRALVLRTKTFTAPSEGYAALLQFFTEASKVVTSSVSTLCYGLRYPKTSLVLGWVPLDGAERR